jgi:demethylmenaquinone methyltransferase / 2-methoxy-6-polyprenyl-1,4-benzoquinol methylase
MTTGQKLRQESTVDPRDNQRGPKVRGMFAEISGRYDLLNRVLSGGRDQAWRRRTVRMTRLKGGESVLDACCGTGDLALLYSVAEPAPARVLGADFTPEMLEIAADKAARLGAAIPFVAADALKLPFDDASFDVVSVGYGVRNFQDLDAGLRELARVLRPGGRLAVLDCTPAKGITGRFANFYINRVMPRIGNLLNGSRSKAYSYLADSVQVFPSAEELAERMRNAGFTEVEFKRLNFGTMAIHVATK